MDAKRRKVDLKPGLDGPPPPGLVHKPGSRKHVIVTEADQMPVIVTKYKPDQDGNPRETYEVHFITTRRTLYKVLTVGE